MDEKNTKIVNCMIGKNAVCNGSNCARCGFDWKEYERRKKLPLVKLDNGLYGKYDGKNYAPIGESREN